MQIIKHYTSALKYLLSSKVLLCPFGYVAFFFRKFQNISKIVLLLSILLLASCGSPDEDHCIYSNDFGQDNFYLPAGIHSSSVIQGEYDPQSGGEVRDWIDTGYVSDGEGFSIRIKGAWNPWGSSGSSPPCKMVARYDNSFTNYCYRSLHDNKEKVATVNNLNNTADGCTESGPTNNAKYGMYHVNRCSLSLNEAEKNSSEQIDGVYTKGMGAYVGLFGKSGYETPLRAYHLFTEKELCDVVRNPTTSLCLDKKGNDITEYLFESVNNKIFIKDDLATNDGLDQMHSDDIYHKPREVVKLIIHDSYYSDNVGGYNVIFDKGVIKSGGQGVFEAVVSLFEDYLLGDVNKDTQERDGGIIKEFYSKIVANSAFIDIVQLLIAFYIIIFGVSIIMGVAQVSGNDALARIVKLGLIMLFISPSSWYVYNEYVIGLFKNGMDSLIKLFGDVSDKVYDESSLIHVAKGNRDSISSNSTRFSFVDYLITKLFSEPVARKIGGLFFGYALGFFYVILIGAAIIIFFLVMMLAAFAYIENLIRMSILLAVGPMLFPFWLFSRTSGIFTKWAGTLASSSLSILMLFVSLYNMLIILDVKFTELLAFKVCLKNISLGYFITFRVYAAESGLSIKSIADVASDIRSGAVAVKDNIKDIITDPENLITSVAAEFVPAGFSVKLVEIFGLIYITKMVIEKIPELSRGIIKVAGVSPPDLGSVASAVFKGASGILSASKAHALDGLKASGAVVKEGGKAVGGLAKMGYFAATGQKDEKERVKQEMIDGLSSIASSSSSTTSKSIVNAAVNEAKKQGLTGSRAASFVRRQAFAKAREGGKSVNFKSLQHELKLHEKSELKKSISSLNKSLAGNPNSFARRNYIRSMIKKEANDMGIKDSRIDKMLKSREFIAEFNRAGVANARDALQRQSPDSLVKYLQSLETERLLGVGRSGFGDKFKSFFGRGGDALNPRRNLRELGRFADERDYYLDKEKRKNVHLDKMEDLSRRHSGLKLELKKNSEEFSFDVKDTAKELAHDISGKSKDLANASTVRKNDALKSGEEFFGKLYDRSDNDSLTRKQYIKKMMQETGRSVKQDLRDRLDYHMSTLSGDKDNVNDLATRKEINAINNALKKVDSEYEKYGKTEDRPEGAYHWVNGVKFDKDGEPVVETTMVIGQDVNINPNSEVAVDDFTGFNKNANDAIVPKFDFANEVAGIRDSIVNNDQNIAVIQDLQLKVAILEMKQRTSTFTVKTKEYEIMKLKMKAKSPNEFADQIATLQTEISELNNSKVYLESQISNLNQNISTLSNE